MSDVVIVGAGPSGMATALELARGGVRSTVLEARGPVGSREQVFNVMAPFADRLQALAPDGALTRLLTPTDEIGITFLPSARGLDAGEVRRKAARTFSGALELDATRSRGDMGAITQAMTGADGRTWSKVGIGDLENGMRELARTQHSGMIDVRYETPVAALRQTRDGAVAVLEGGGEVPARAIVDASGRNLLGADRLVYPESTSWLGARYPPNPGTETASSYPIERFYGRTSAPNDRNVSVALPTRDRTVLWTEVPDASPSAVSDAAAARILREAAQTAGAEGDPLTSAPWRVRAQLWTTQQAAAGHVFAVGDSVRAPYFMTSTGAASAIVHDAPQAVDQIRALLAGTRSARQATSAHDDAVRGANELLLEHVRPALLKDAGVRARDAGAPTITPAAAR